MTRTTSEAAFTEQASRGRVSLLSGLKMQSRVRVLFLPRRVNVEQRAQMWRVAQLIGQVHIPVDPAVCFQIEVSMQSLQ
jgi:hypothetical protein